MKRYERIAAAAFMVFGLAISIHSYLNLKLGQFHHPDAGFMPFWSGVGLITFSGVWFWTSRGPDERPEPFWGKGEWVRPLIVAVMMVLYGALMEGLGYLPTTFLFLVAWQAVVEREGWKKTGLISVVGTLTMYLLFQYLLGVPLPAGILAQ